MAKIIEPISDEDLKRITVANLRNEYKKLSDFYKKKLYIVLVVEIGKELFLFMVLQKVQMV